MKKTNTGVFALRAFVAVAVAVHILAAAAGCNYPDEILLQEFRTDTVAVSGKTAPLDAEEFGLRYGYWRLDESERAVYCAVKKAVFSFGSVSADGCDYDTFKKVFVVFCADYPECFWVTGDWSVSGYISGGVRKYTMYSPSYRYTKEQVGEIEGQINAAADEFLDCIPAGASDYDKVLAVYRFVASYAKYDTETARKLGEGQVDSSTDRSCSIDGFFLDRQAVGSGFSKATQLLLHRLGIECAYVTGKSDGVGHSWNMVKLDGDYYFIDTTWANTRSEGTEHITYDFFCLTSEELAFDHTIDAEIELPQCNATKMNYYVYNGLVAASCEEGELAELFGKALELEGGSVAAIKFASPELFDEAYTMLFENGGIFRVLKIIEGVNCRSIKFSYDTGRLTVTVYLDV